MLGSYLRVHATCTKIYNVGALSFVTSSSTTMEDPTPTTLFLHFFRIDVSCQLSVLVLFFWHLPLPVRTLVYFFFALFHRTPHFGVRVLPTALLSQTTPLTHLKPVDVTILQQPLIWKELRPQWNSLNNCSTCMWCKFEVSMCNHVPRTYYKM